MTVNLRTKTAMVIENGIFVEMARRLADEFGRVLYFAPWASGYPTSRGLLIGAGDDKIERVRDMWEHIDEVDIFIFPDCYEGGLQQHLVNMGKRVWGCRLGAELELDRVKQKEILKSIGVEVGPYKVIEGLDALRKHLKSNDDQFIKISSTRGDAETFHAPTYEKIEPRLDELEHSLGAKKKIMEFIVEQGIPDAIEVGYDGYTIDGKFPKGAIIGIEVKDKAYVGRTMRYSELPEEVKGVNDKLGPVLKKYGYRGLWSTEIRCKDGHAYPIDFTARAGSPPSELYQNMISNLGEIMWYGAEGIIVEPEYLAPWGAEVLLLSDWADKNWQHVEFPKAIRDNVKLRNFTVIEGEHYIVPQLCGMPEIGSVVAMGNTAEEAIAECKRLAEKVDGYYIEKPVESMDEALEDLKEILGEKAEDKPETKEQKKARELHKAGKISDKQYEKMTARG